MQERRTLIVQRIGKLLCTVAALASVLWLGIWARTQFHHLHAAKAGRSVNAGRRGTIYAGENKGRRVYPFSVIPGGAYSADELARSRRIDAVVAKHYAGFGNTVAVQKTVQDTYMYVAYRKDDKVYWTKTKHRIPRGEYVLTDGHNFARARCGNRLSAAPQEPVLNAGEPGDDRLDKPEAPGDMYLASLEPSLADPLFSIPDSADDIPGRDALSSSPKLTNSPRSQMASNAVGGPGPMGGNYGATPYVIQPTRNNTSSSSTPSNGTPTQTGQTTPPAGGTSAVTDLSPTPEPAASALLLTGVISMLLCLRPRRQRR